MFQAMGYTYDQNAIQIHRRDVYAICKSSNVCSRFIPFFKGKGVNISLPSLRIDAFSLDVMGKVQDIKKSSLTFAPEAGSQRLRDVINKGLTKEMEEKYWHLFP